MTATRTLNVTGLRLVSGVPPRRMPCPLCGQLITFHAVAGDGVELVFRAVEVGDRWWIPARGHGGTNACPDPHPDTARNWTSTVYREAYRAWRRAKAAR